MSDKATSEPPLEGLGSAAKSHSTSTELNNTASYAGYPRAKIRVVRFILVPRARRFLVVRYKLSRVALGTRMRALSPGFFRFHTA